MPMNRVLVLICLAAFFVCSLLFEATTAVRYIPYPVIARNRMHCDPRNNKCVKEIPANHYHGGCNQMDRCRNGENPPPRLLSVQVDPEDKEQELQVVVSVAPSLSEMLEDGQQYYQGMSPFLVMTKSP
ncbi:hypothetical protein IFM89_014369 [Coptis chinensis]|uniref:Uncharacterized protein n=1 Tax=Coptis chinensis TaxID=261450 RepID=A0A835GZ87_9MAGN|nr:hypothetical protein IFM89_014369 [Coptis chinensis]